MIKPDRNAGFTMIEVLVALAIMGLGLGAIFQLYGTLFKGSARAEATSQALLVAESKLSEFSIAGNLTAGRQSGTTKNGYAWVANIAELTEADAKKLDSLPVRAFTVTISVNHPGTPAIILQNIRLRTA